MAERLQIYYCEKCGNIVEVMRGGAGTLVCCGEPMQLLAGNTTDAATEKHVPVVERASGKVTVKVGSVAHPMADDHYIEWIELIAGNESYRKFLSPGDTPEAVFAVSADSVTARAHCNLHGVWKS